MYTKQETVRGSAKYCSSFRLAAKEGNNSVQFNSI